MKLLLQFSRRFLYRHPGQLMMALVGIAAGVAVVTGVALMRDVLLESLDRATIALSGPDYLQIENPGGMLDERLYAQLALRTGAPVLVPVLRDRGRFQNQPLELLATDPLAIDGGGPMALSGAATGALLGQANAVILNRRTLQSLGLGPGQTMTIRLAGQDHLLDVIAELPGRPDLDNRLLMDLANAQVLLNRPGELSSILAPDSARDWLAEQLPEGLLIRDADQRRDSAARLTAGMRTNLTALSLLGLVVGLFVVYSVLAFLLVQRRRQIGMLRAVGVTRAQIGLVLAGETLVLSGLGALIGLVVGTWLSEQLLVLVQSPLSELYGLVASSTIAPERSQYLLIWALSVGLALISVSGLLRQALSIQPGQLSRQANGKAGLGPGMRLALVAGLSVSGFGLILLAAGLAWVLFGLFLTLLACALLAPWIMVRCLETWHRLRPQSLDGRAIGMLSGARQRLAPAAAALSLAMGLSVGIAMMVIGFRLAVDDWVERLLRADVYLTVPGARIEQSLVDSLTEWPELSAISSVRQRELPDGRRLLAYDLPDPAWAGFDWLAGGSSQAREAFVAGTGALVTEALARHHQLALGDSLELPTPTGPLALSIVGIYRDYASDRGTVAIAAEAYRQRFEDPYRDSLGLYFHAQPPPELTERLDQLEIEVTLTRREQVRNQTLAIFDRTFRITWALAVLVGIIAGVALISALLALGLERGRDYATLRALGLTRRGLAAWVISQTTGMAAAAAAMAIPISLLIHAVLSLAVQPRAFGWTVSFSLPWQPWLILIPLALLTGLLAGIYPAWKIARREPADMLRGS
jgi:putative ABC transport system permease protein